MGARVRWAQVVGLLLFAAAAFFPMHVIQGHPARVFSRAASSVRPVQPETPAQVLGEAARRDLEEGRPGERLWSVRRWYPFSLAPLWLLALLGAALVPRARALVGGALLLLAVALAVFEACYLGVEYAPLLPEVLGRSEVLLAWGVVVFVLFARRGVDRALGCVEAHVAAQALLGWLHLLTLPGTEARPWWGQHSALDVFGALTTNFLPPFWIALAGLCLAFVPVYMRRVAARARPAPLAEGGRPLWAPEL